MIEGKKVRLRAIEEKDLELQQRVVDAREIFVKTQQGGQDDLSPTVGGKSFTSYEDRGQKFKEEVLR